MGPAANEASTERYLRELRQRIPQLEREYFRELNRGSDPFLRLFQQSLQLEHRSSYEAMLSTFLTGSERDRLQVDRQFTRAWRMFVRQRWFKRQFKRLGISFIVIVIILAGIALAVWAVTHLIAPKTLETLLPPRELAGLDLALVRCKRLAHLLG